MEVAKRNEEKQVALEILSRIPSAETLALAAARILDRDGDVFDELAHDRRAAANAMRATPDRHPEQVAA